jgi:cytoskeletal protein CcmA (bactofilin family)
LVLVGILNLDGELHIKGNLDAQGCVYLKKGSRLIVDGKKKIKGVKKEVDEFRFEY